MVKYLSEILRSHTSESRWLKESEVTLLDFHLETFSVAMVGWRFCRKPLSRVTVLHIGTRNGRNVRPCRIHVTLALRRER